MAREKSTPSKVSDPEEYWRLMIQSKKQKRAASKKKKANKLAYKVEPPSEKNQNLYIGSFRLGTSNNVIPESWSVCNVSLQTTPETDNLLLEFENDNTVIVNLLADAPTVIDIAVTKIFNVNFIQSKDDINMLIYFKTLPLKTHTKKVREIIKELFHIFFNITDNQNKFKTDLENSNDNRKTLLELFRRIKETQTASDISKTTIKSDDLRPELRPYQADAVRWMIEREQNSDSDANMLHPAYTKVILPSGFETYYDKYTGLIELSAPKVRALQTGGVLADEMGLGKTVEVLACILLHRKGGTETRVKGAPKIFKQGRKRAQNVENSSHVSYVETKKPKYIDIPPEFIKKPKAPIKVALETWYESILRSVNEPASSSSSNPKIACICGSATSKKLVQCIDCLTKQHSTCMGYNSNEDGDYRCPQCWKKMPIMETRATLIVCPPSLKGQWTREICKHIKSGLSVLEYEGSNAIPVYPTQFEKYDLVITTYNVLQNDLRLATCTEVKSLRKHSKYGVPGSPISLMKWWRLCFDESQVVDSVSSMISEMSHKLIAHHRWAISGTPVSKGISDLYSVIDFLQFEPYNEQEVFNNLLCTPYMKGDIEPMVKFLSKVLWRTQKCNVLDQINIPPQTSHVYTHQFTAVERYFYDREHEMCCHDFLEKLKHFDLNTPLKCLSKGELKKLLEPLVSLRRACAHHNAVKGRYLVTKKAVNSMSDLLDALIAKNVAECEDYLRAYISTLNGKAGIYLLLSNPPDAIEQYRKVMQSIARFTDDKSTGVQLTIDKLQQVHTMHNLAEILATHPAIGHTLHEDTLREDCLEIERQYINKFNKQAYKNLSHLSQITEGIESQRSKCTMKLGQWYAAIVEDLLYKKLFQELKNRIVTTLENNHYTKIGSISSARDIKILNMVKKWEEEVNYLREDTIDAINLLYTINEENMIIDDALVITAAECHLRPEKKHSDSSKKECAVCEANSKLKQYESSLFTMELTTRDATHKNWKPTIEEQIMRGIHAFGKYKTTKEEVIAEGELCINIYDAFKKEFKELRKLWTNLDAQICAYDEVDICKIRLQLKAEEEGESLRQLPVLKNLSYDLENPFANINQLRQHELDYQLMQANIEENEHIKSLEKNLGTHKYLKTLYQQQNSGQSPDPCPICKNQLDTKWNILKCGHCYCIECVQVLLGRSQGKSLQCSICREMQNINDINYVEIKTVQDDSKVEYKVKGNCSTKIEVVVRLIMKLKKEDDKVKVLVFSNWSAILDVIKEIFDLNDIKAQVLTSTNLERKLSNFKDESRNITALLLPVSLGARGLNLIQATHVIFVEPLLDPADELQAIGRVHRIGQTKPTFVHKFIINETIEENIHSYISSNADEWDKNTVTLHHIKKLFVGNSSNIKELPVLNV